MEDGFKQKEENELAEAKIKQATAELIRDRDENYISREKIEKEIEKIIVPIKESKRKTEEKTTRIVREFSDYKSQAETGKTELEQKLTELSEEKQRDDANATIAISTQQGKYEKEIRLLTSELDGEKLKREQAEQKANNAKKILDELETELKSGISVQKDTTDIVELGKKYQTGEQEKKTAQEKATQIEQEFSEYKSQAETGKTELEQKLTELTDANKLAETNFTLEKADQQKKHGKEINGYKEEIKKLNSCLDNTSKIVGDVKEELRLAISSKEDTTDKLKEQYQTEEQERKQTEQKLIQSEQEFSDYKSRAEAGKTDLEQKLIEFTDANKLAETNFKVSFDSQQGEYERKIKKLTSDLDIEKQKLEGIEKKLGEYKKQRDRELKNYKLVKGKEVANLKTELKKTRKQVYSLGELVKKSKEKKKEAPKLKKAESGLILETTSAKENFYMQGVGAYKQKRYTLAKNLLEKVINQEANNSSALCYHADSLAKLGRWEEAIEEYNLCLKMDANNSDAYNGLGRIYISEGDNKKAISNWKKAAKLGNLFAIYNLEDFKEESDEGGSKWLKSFFEKLKEKVSRKRIDDLEFIEMYDHANSLLDHPYKEFEASTLGNVKSILEQQKRLHDYVIEQCVDDKKRLKKIEEIDARIEQRKDRDEEIMDEFVPFNTKEENESYRAKEGIEDFPEKREYYVLLAMEWGL